ATARGKLDTAVPCGSLSFAESAPRSSRQEPVSPFLAGTSVSVVMPASPDINVLELSRQPGFGCNQSRSSCRPLARASITLTGRSACPSESINRLDFGYDIGVESARVGRAIAVPACLEPQAGTARGARGESRTTLVGDSKGPATVLG